MPIEFHCPGCEKKLKTGDDKAGKSAKCPQCGTTITVPAAAGSDDEFGEGFGEGFPAFDDVESPLPATRRRAATEQVACPMCGAMNDEAATHCLACGEELALLPGASRNPAGSGVVDIGEALNGGWAVFRDQLGGLLGILFVTAFAMMAASLPLYLLMFGGIAAVMGAAGPNQPPNMMLFGLVQMIFTIVFQFVIWFFSIGCTRALLLLVRRQQLDIGAIFTSGRFYGLMALNSLVLFVVTQGPGVVGSFLQNVGMQGNNPGPLMFVGLGLTLLSILLSVVIYPFIWPYTYIIVDDRAGTLRGLDPLRRAWEITPGSRLTSFALFLLLGVINMLGLFALCIGVFFTMAYMLGTLTVAYEQMSPRLRKA